MFKIWAKLQQKTSPAVMTCMEGNVFTWRRKYKPLRVLVPHPDPLSRCYVLKVKYIRYMCSENIREKVSFLTLVCFIENVCLSLIMHYLYFQDTLRDRFDVSQTKCLIWNNDGFVTAWKMLCVLEDIGK